MHYALSPTNALAEHRSPPDLMHFQKYALLPYALLHFLLYRIQRQFWVDLEVGVLRVLGSRFGVAWRIGIDASRDSEIDGDRDVGSRPVPRPKGSLRAAGNARRE